MCVCVCIYIYIYIYTYIYIYNISDIIIIFLEICLKEIIQNAGKKYVQRYVTKLWIYGYIGTCVYTYCVCIYIYTYI